MSTFKEIRGQLIRSVSTDPANPQIGQIWYNNTTGVLKGYQTIAAAWASGGNLNTARYFITGTGPKTAALAIAGSTGSPDQTTVTGATEEYNGSNWTNTPSLNTARSNAAGFGASSTSAVCATGIVSPNTALTATEEYNGSSWTNSGSANTNVYAAFSTGIESAGLKGQGDNLPGVRRTNNVEEYNGSSWTTVNSMGSSGYYSKAIGIQTAAIVIGGNPSTPGYTNKSTEEYDGTNWTNGPNTNQISTQGGSAGSASDGLYYGGDNGGTKLTHTESWDGTSWSNTTLTMNTGRSLFASGNGNSTSSTAWAAGGQSPSITTATEEFVDTFNATRTLTTS